VLNSVLNNTYKLIPSQGRANQVRMNAIHDASVSCVMKVKIQMSFFVASVLLKFDALMRESV
jgi:hypothetical protein